MFYLFKMIVQNNLSGIMDKNKLCKFILSNINAKETGVYGPSRHSCVSFYARFVGRPVSRRGERSYLKATKEVLDEESTLSLLPFVNSFSTDNPLEARRVFGYVRRASTSRDLQTVIYFCFANSHAGCMT